MVRTRGVLVGDLDLILTMREGKSTVGSRCVVVLVAGSPTTCCKGHPCWEEGVVLLRLVVKEISNWVCGCCCWCKGFINQ